MKMINIIKLALTSIGTALGWFLGGYDTMMITLLIFMAIDYLSGVMCAIVKKELSSEIGFKGIFKKILILFLVGMANMLGTSIHIEGLRYIVISFYLANEGISIIENASMLDLPVPQKVKDVLKQLKDDTSEGGETK